MTRIVAVAIVAAVAFLALVARDARRREAWQEALAEPATRRALDAGLADIAEGRTRPWSWLRADADGLYWRSTPSRLALDGPAGVTNGVSFTADDEPDWLGEYDPSRHVVWPYGGSIS